MQKRTRTTGSWKCDAAYLETNKTINIMKKILTLSVMLFTLTAIMAAGIDRKAVVTRNNPVVKSIDPLASLSVGNGDFAFTVDATGL